MTKYSMKRTDEGIEVLTIMPDAKLQEQLDLVKEQLAALEEEEAAIGLRLDVIAESKKYLVWFIKSGEKALKK